MNYVVVGGVGYRRTYTEQELQEIERLRAEMRERLTCPDDQYEEVCRKHGFKRENDR